MNFALTHVAGRLVARPMVVVLAFVILIGGVARGQDITDDMVGQNVLAWRAWSEAIAHLERDKVEDATKAFEQVAEMKLSDLRLALMAERTGTLRFEQRVADKSLGEVGDGLLAQITNGRKQRQLADDGWHFAAIGRFKYADANFKALIDSAPDPVALLELARTNPTRHEILIKLVANADVGPAAKLMLEMLQEGERLLRTDAREIEINIERLAGPPRLVYQATNNLKASGEYAVPHLLAYLRNPDKRDLHPAIIQLMPLLGRGALNPLVLAVQTRDSVVAQVVARALGQLGYQQAAPYLARAGLGERTSGAVRQECLSALQAVNRAGTNDPAVLFRRLAEDYYGDVESVRADPRYNTANIWYFDDKEDELRFTAVPREIFNDIMTARCAEAALNLAANDAESIALWVAANFRREAKLGMNVESDETDANAVNDPTKSAGYPRSAYFARAAGPIYNHLALRRAVADKDPRVALGAIAALAATAGPGSLTGPEDFKQPLVQALAFPNRLVRIKAALALGRSLPIGEFVGAHQVVPVLAEALQQQGRRTVLLVDPESQTQNQMQAVLRAAGFDVVTGSRYYAAREAARRDNLVNFDAAVIASDVAEPGLSEAVENLRGHFETSAVPVLVITKKGQTAAAIRAARQFEGVETALVETLDLGDAEEISRTLMDKLNDAAKKLGMQSLDGDAALGLAAEAADVLRLMALSRSKLFDFTRAESALVGALQQADEGLRIKAAGVLAHVPTETAQRAIAEAALADANSPTQRVAAFGSLAESARLNGNKLTQGLVEKLVELVAKGDDLTLRTAGSQALGALNLTSNLASDLIRAQAQ